MLKVFFCAYGYRSFCDNCFLALSSNVFLLILLTILGSMIVSPGMAAAPLEEIRQCLEAAERDAKSSLDQFNRRVACWEKSQVKQLTSPGLQAPTTPVQPTTPRVAESKPPEALPRVTVPDRQEKRARVPQPKLAPRASPQPERPVRQGGLVPITASILKKTAAIQELEQIVVSDTRLPAVAIDRHEIPVKVTVITAQDIEESGVRTVQEALQSVAGVVFFDGVGNNFEQKIELRGYNGDPFPATSVFVDGVRINEPDFGGQNLSLVPLESIERIEILPGPSAIYGQYGLAGVVNIITKKGGNKTRLVVETMRGSYYRSRESISVGGPFGWGRGFRNFGFNLTNDAKPDWKKMMTYLVSFERDFENGYRKNSDARLTKIFGKLGFQPTYSTDITIGYTYTKNYLGQAGANLSLSQYASDRTQDASPKDYQKNSYNLLTLTVRQLLPLDIIFDGNAFYRRLGQKRYTTSASGWVANNDYKAESKGGTWQLSMDTLIYGMPFLWTLVNEYRRDAFNINQSGYDVPKEQDTLALAWQGRMHLLDALTFTPSLRYDHTQFNYKDFSGSNPDAYKRFSRVTLGAGATFRLAPKDSLYINYSEGFRPPTIDEMFNQGSGYNNLSLKPVTSSNYEVGAKLDLGGATVDMAGFWTETRNEIFGTCTVCIWGNTGYDWLNRNIDATRRRGIEATLKVIANRYLSGMINYAFTEAIYTSDVKFGSNRDIKNGSSIELIPKHKLDVSINLKPEWFVQDPLAKRFTILLSTLYRSTKFALDDEANIYPRIPGYNLWNIKINYEQPITYGILNIFLKIQNIGGVEYYNYALISSGVRYVGAQPTRQAFFGVRYEWE